MAELVHFEVNPLPNVRVAGRALRVAMSMEQNPIPAHWERCFGDGTFAALEALGEQVFDPSYVGLMCRWDGSDGMFTYLVGMMLKEGAPVPEGYDAYDVGACSAAVAWIKGTEQIYDAAHPLTEAEMQRRGIGADLAQGWCMELYNCPRFTTPGSDGDRILDYYIPCKP